MNHGLFSSHDDVRIQTELRLVPFLFWCIYGARSRDELVVELGTLRIVEWAVVPAVIKVVPPPASLLTSSSLALT